MLCGSWHKARDAFYLSFWGRPGPQQVPQPCSGRHSAAALCLSALLEATEREARITQTPSTHLPARGLMIRLVSGLGWVSRTFWALHHLSKFWMELVLNTSWLNVPLTFKQFLKWLFFHCNKNTLENIGREGGGWEERWKKGPFRWIPLNKCVYHKRVFAPPVPAYSTLCLLVCASLF